MHRKTDYLEMVDLMRGSGPRDFRNGPGGKDQAAEPPGRKGEWSLGAVRNMLARKLEAA
jgi:hypothetical protein